MVRGQDLVARREVERADNGVHAGRGVWDERDIVRIALDQSGQRGARIVEMAFELSVHEPDRVSLHARAPLGLLLQHRPWARPERSVIEVSDLGVEWPQSQVIGIHCVSIYGCAVE